MDDLMTSPSPNATTGRPLRRRPAWVRWMVRNRTILPALLIIGLLVFFALFSKMLSPYDPLTTNLPEKLKPPMSEGHFLGTDGLGRDMIARLLFGARISLIVGLGAVFISGGIGVLVGLVSGYFSGKVDALLMRLGDIQLGFPSFLMAISIMAAWGTGLEKVILAISISGWVTYARVTRAQVLSLREKEYVEAARAAGNSNLRIMFSHILPNTMAPIIVIATFQVALSIMAEASLSFLGLGVTPQTPTWGSMLAEGRDYMRTAWWVATFPGLAILFTVMGVNMLGDWMRDHWDPRLRKR
ncbi:MAG: ABC transporter permease [Firmicutes bacterium]|nr:ABC transporter permease [Bacillota bacterium]